MGGVTGGTAATLHRLSKKAAEGRDGTVYGVHSNANYFTHHATAISLATVTAAAEAIERGVNKRARKLALRPHAVAADLQDLPRFYLGRSRAGACMAANFDENR